MSPFLQRGNQMVVQPPGPPPPIPDQPTRDTPGMGEPTGPKKVKKYPANPGTGRADDAVFTDWKDIAEDPNPVKPAGPPRRDR
jgi:hypothetical protein